MTGVHAEGQVRTWIRVPGMLCTAEIFTAMDPYLRLGGARLDARIQGNTLDEAAAYLLEAARAQEGPVGIIGLSLGAIVAMAAAAEAPDVFDATVLISTNPRGPRPGQIRAWTSMAQRSAEGAFHTIASELAPTLFAPARAAGPLLHSGIAMAEQLGRRAFAEQVGVQLTRRDLRPELSRVGARTLVIAGSEDQLCSVSMHQDITAAMPGAELHVLPGAGHLMPLEDPASTANIINLWNQRNTL